MGDYLLMKTVLLLWSITFSQLIANELTWVDEQVDAIKPNRDGVSNMQIAKLRNPFIYLKKNRPKEEQSNSRLTTPNLPSSKNTASLSAKKSRSNTVTSLRVKNRKLRLNAIINSAALINDTWYKKGDTIAGYKVMYISKTKVKLSKNNKITFLTTQSNSNKLKFK